MLLLVLAVASIVLTIAILGALRLAVRAYTRAVLGSRGAQEGPIRELLAERVGDRTLSIAYWLADREAFVDEFGRQVALPAPGSGRAWTAVEHDGRRVAAIIHDAELDTTPELVNAAAAAAALALDNERLKADLRARVEDLRISRARIVEAADAARRRLERDLHDGAQQQLVSLALDLRLLRARLKGSDAVPMVEEISDEAGRRAGGAARAGARHPPGDPHRPRARPGRAGPRRPRAAARRGRGRAGRAAVAARSRPPRTSSSPRRSPTSPATPRRTRRGWRSPAAATTSG